jgi:TRAP-type C4-dicarboxylate transport system permease small subunit
MATQQDTKPDPLAELPFGELAAATEAGFADDLSGFRLRDHGPEDWVGLVLLWAMGVLVFVQFFTRYALNDSISWTEEVARYLLIGLTFVGSAVAVRRNTHIHVEFLYGYLPKPLGLALSTLVDLLRTAFLGLCAWISWDLFDRMRSMPMDSIDHDLGPVYAAVFGGFVLMALRSVQVAWRHWRAGGSALTIPGAGGPAL